MLVTHVLASVGWFGAVAAFLVLAVVGLESEDARLVSGVYLAEWLITWYVIVPLGGVSFLSGILQGVGTQWGLVRYWWVLVKLILTSGALVLLVVHTRVVDTAADHLGWGAMSAVDGMDAVRLQLVVDSAAALGVLVITTVLSVIKPRGRTPFRTLPGLHAPRAAASSRR